MSPIPILIIDDDPINLKLEKILLATEKYDVHTASDAEEGSVILEKIQPKVILIDLDLTGMSGLDFTRKLKSDPKFKEIKIIAVTACAMKGDKEKAIAYGCDDYIPKPFDAKNLLLVVANFVKNRLNP